MTNKQQQSREARRVRSVQRGVQDTAADILHQAGAISPTAAASLGAPMDPSQGFDFDPAARPSDLPMPGATPGGDKQGGPKPEAFDGQHIGDQRGRIPMPPQPGMPAAPPSQPATLPDDRAAVMHQMNQPAAPAPTGPVRAEHPILAKLRQDLGIESTDAYDVQIGQHRWTLRALTSGEVGVASRLADQVAGGVVEHEIVNQAAISAYSVVAIDGTPCYQVFQVDVPPGVVIVDPMRPPTAVRSLAAQQLYEFIATESKTQLGQRLYDAYLDKADGDGAVSTYLDDPENKRVRYRCGVSTCDEEMLVAPRRDPATNTPVNPQCRWCRKEMQLVGVETPDPLA